MKNDHNDTDTAWQQKSHLKCQVHNGNVFFIPNVNGPSKLLTNKK